MKDGSVGEGHLLGCLQQFIEKKDMTFAQIICSECGITEDHSNSDSDSAEFLSGLLSALKNDFPLFGDLFSTRISIDLMCSACESPLKVSHVNSFFIVPGMESKDPLSFSAAFNAALNNSIQALASSESCYACESVCCTGFNDFLNAKGFQ